MRQTLVDVMNAKVVLVIDSKDIGLSRPLTDKLIQIVERYFSRLRDEHGLGAGTDERSYYPALASC